jgi:nucleoside phosphorylase
MKKVLVLFAQFGEAVSTIKAWNASPEPTSVAHIWSEGKIHTCYRCSRGLIIIGNVGVFSAQLACAKYIHACDEIWNIGLAGALKDTLPLGTLLEIQSVGKHTHLPTDLDLRSKECVRETIPIFSLPITGAKLISSDFPIHDEKVRKILGQEWDLVDMEGYGVASSGICFSKPWRLWKIVSDFASPGGRELIKKNKPFLSEKIADFLTQQLLV